MAASTTTRAVLRQRLGQATGSYISSTTTSAGSGGGTTVVDTTIVRYDTSVLVDRWLLLTSGSNAGESRRVSSVSSSTITVTSAYTAQVADAVTYEVYTWDPTLMDYAMEEALRTVYPQIYLPIRDETLVVDNLIADPSFETNTTGPVAFTSWTNLGSPTLTAETSRNVHLSQAAGIAATGATEGLEQNLFTSVNYDQVVGKTLQVSGWVWTGTASAARLRVTFDGSTFTDGPYHAGSDEWEGPNLQYITATIPADMTEMTVSCEVINTVTAYFDLVTARIDPISRYTIPTSIIGLARVEQQVRLSEPDGGFTALGDGHVPISGHVLRLIGKGQLTVPASDTATTEIDGNQIEAVLARAAARLFRAQSSRDQGSRDIYIADETLWENRYQELIRRPGYRSPRMASYPYQVEEDSTGRFVYLPRGRA